jgi:hypothetical protein
MAGGPQVVMAGIGPPGSGGLASGPGKEDAVNGLKRAAAVGLLLAILVGTACGAWAQAARPLFAALPASQKAHEAPEPDDALALRAISVAVDLGALAGEDAPGGAPSVLLNLFEDASWTAWMERIEWRSPQRYTWVGLIPDAAHGQAVLVVEDGVMAGNVRADGRLYQIRRSPTGLYRVVEADTGAFPDEAPPRIPSPRPLKEALPKLKADPCCTGSIYCNAVDVMVVYTQAAETGAGGPANMGALIQLAMDETNQSYANSGVMHRLRLVHKEKVTYSETGLLCHNTNPDNDLDRLTFTGDGHLDGVQTLRNLYRADVVVLIVENGGAYAGCGWFMHSDGPWFADYAYSVVARAYAAGHLTLAHEVGHNMGARHDWYVDPETTPWPYAHGYVYLPGGWRTVMAYNQECYDNGINCARIPNWSNPDVTYEGVPTGVPQTEFHPADNRQTLNNTSCTVSKFRDHVNSLSCAGAATLTSAVPYNGNTTGAPFTANAYGCVANAMTGPERVHTITTTSTTNLTAALTGLSVDLDVFILDACDPAECRAWGDATATYNSAPPGTYYIVVDGRDRAAGSYTLTVTGPGPDTSPPWPDPMTWSTPPYASGTESVAMMAATASDPSGPVQYFFDFTDSPTGGTGGADATWQPGTSYTNVGLGPNHQYGYRVKARDGGLRETGYSTPSRYAYTAIETPAGIEFGAVTASSIAARSASTPSGLTRGSSGLIIENTTRGVDSGWKQNNDLWDSGGLSPNTSHTFRAKARNGDGLETGYSATASKHTLANAPATAGFSNVTATCIRANWAANGNPAGTQYWCENTTAGTDSGWSGALHWDSCGLAGATSYAFRVKARNGEGVETGWTDLGARSTTMGADLTGSWVSLLQSCTPVTGGTRCTLNGQFTVHNAGDKKAGKSRLKFFLSDDAVYDALSDTLVRSLKVGKMVPGATGTKSFSAALALNASASGRHIIAFTDANGTIPEGNEANNHVPYGPVP